ncbi:hypothetical protein DFH06DRAFT_1367268 [Mycena polygramma]|nr:hypothetical protein DFH06DRAFT_1367268 [Mycena polygramma]
MNPRESSRSCSHLKRLNLVFLQMVRRIATNLAKILLCLTVYRRVGALDNTSIWDAGSSVTDVRRAGLKTLLLSYILPRRLSFPSSRRGQATRERRGVRHVPGACTPRRCATGPLPARARLGSCRPQQEALMGRDARMRGGMGVVVMRQESIRRWLVIGPGTSAYQINASLDPASGPTERWAALNDGRSDQEAVNARVVERAPAVSQPIWADPCYILVALPTNRLMRMSRDTGTCSAGAHFRGRGATPKGAGRSGCGCGWADVCWSTAPVLRNEA